MRLLVLTAALAATALSSGVAWAQSGRPALTLFEAPNFQGRQFTYEAPSTEVYKQGFQARSARTSGGVWTLCEDARGPCQKVAGQAANLNINVRTVRPGELEITLYEGPNFSGRQFTYTGASNEVYRQGFKANSARTTGGAWTVCGEGFRVNCQVIDGQAANIGMQIASVAPGRNADAGSGGSGGRGNDSGRWGDNRSSDDRGRGGSRGDSGRDRGRDDGSRDDRTGGDSGVRKVRYDCTGGVTLRVTFDHDLEFAEIRTAGEDTVVLNRERSGSGFRYESRSRSFTGKGDEATYVIGRRAPLYCHAR